MVAGPCYRQRNPVCVEEAGSGIRRWRWVGVVSHVDRVGRVQWAHRGGGSREGAWRRFGPLRNVTRGRGIERDRPDHLSISRKRYVLTREVEGELRRDRVLARPAARSQRVEPLRRCRGAVCRVRVRPERYLLVDGASGSEWAAGRQSTGARCVDVRCDRPGKGPRAHPDVVPPPHGLFPPSLFQVPITHAKLWKSTTSHLRVRPAPERVTESPNSFHPLASKATPGLRQFTTSNGIAL